MADSLKLAPTTLDSVPPLSIFKFFGLFWFEDRAMVQVTRKQVKARQIAQELRRLAHSGQWRDGETLPSLRELSRTFAVSHETVRRALQVLVTDGVVRPVHGFGMVVNRPAPASPSGANTAYLQVRSNEFGTEKQGLWEALVAGFQAGTPEPLIQLAGFERPGLRDPLGDVVHLPAWEIAQLGTAGRLLDLNAFGGLPAFYGEDLCLLPENLPTTGPCWGIPVAFDLNLAYLNLATLSNAEQAQLAANWTLEGIANWAAARGCQGTPGGPVRWPLPQTLLSFCGVDIWAAARFDDTLAGLPAILARLLAAHARAPLTDGSWALADYAGQALRDFLTGHWPLVFHHSYAMPYVLQHTAFPLAVWPLPLPPGQGQVRVSLSCAISRQCSHPEAAVAFIRYLASPAGQGILAAGRSNIPMRQSVALGPAFAAPPPLGLPTVVQRLGPTTEANSLGGRPMAMAYAAVWNQEILACLQDGQSLDETIARLARRGRALLQAYGVLTI